MEQSNNIISEKSNKLNVCFDVVTLSRQRNCTRAVAVYYLLKSKYKNSCIFRYRSRMGEIAAGLCISTKTLYTYLHQLRALGLVYDHADNLVLISTRKLKEAHKERRKCKISITDKEDIKTIEARLLAKVIELHCNKIAKFKEIAKFNRRYRDRGKKTNGANDNRTSISVRNLQKLLQLSQPKVNQVIQTLNSLGVIATNKRKPVLLDRGAAPLKYSLEFPGYHFLRDGWLWVVWGNTHELIEYPVRVRELSAKQYVINYKRMFCKK